MKQLLGLLLVCGLLAGGGVARAGVAPTDSLWALVRRPAVADTLRARLLTRLCTAWYDRDLDSAIRYGERGLAVARRTRLPELILAAHYALGVAYVRRHRVPASVQQFSALLRLAQQARQPKYEVLAYVSLANIYSDERTNQPAARRYYNEALTLARRTGQAELIGLAERTLGLMLMEEGNLGEAEVHIRRAQGAFAHEGRRVDQAVVLSYLGELLLAQHRPQAAISEAEKAVRLMPATKYYPQACLHDLLNRAATAAGQLDRALAYGQRAVQLAHAAQMPATEADIMMGLIDLHERRGEYAAALRLYKRRTTLHDSLFTQEKEAELNASLARFETERKQQAIRVLTQRNRIQQLEVDRQRSRVRLLGVGALALALGLAGFGGLYWQLRRSRQRLARSEGQLRRLNHTKDLLMGVVGHDLRGPVAAFQQVAPILRLYARHPHPGELAELADEIEAGTTRLGTLLDNLLHWSRAQADEVTNYPQAVEPAALVADVLALYQPVAAAKGLDLRADVPPDLPAAWVDAALLATVLRNLVNNAVKFTPAGGHVTVSVRPAGAALAVTVADTGVGVPPERLATLFDPAARRSTAGTAGEKGTGLGLAVCHHFVRLLGGELRAESGRNAGTTFRFQVPLAPAESAS